MAQIVRLLHLIDNPLNEAVGERDDAKLSTEDYSSLKEQLKEEMKGVFFLLAFRLGKLICERRGGEEKVVACFNFFFHLVCNSAHATHPHTHPPHTNTHPKKNQPPTWRRRGGKERKSCLAVSPRISLSLSLTKRLSSPPPPFSSSSSSTKKGERENLLSSLIRLGKEFVGRGNSFLFFLLLS